ncbi:hypothetical protein GCM10025868_21440 [Angustibacter aerolatus]|uniref:N-acetyltransferase domain-containing protein n=1 Tax=Angustibacter aerolatus TaxID=1162965 RepID=A0ABQ6JGH8_9ACTN|nr:GNAT family N-acetyltransferase [Angustibacter aerolatus]GMA86894.1 hypothetical protein GCM10025868_21440 [Angustibacter aerolatus]
MAARTVVVRAWCDRCRTTGCCPSRCCRPTCRCGRSPPTSRPRCTRWSTSGPAGPTSPATTCGRSTTGGACSSAPTRRPSSRLAAWAGDVPVGVVLGKVFSDGTGWVAHLAVDRARQGRGLGRALLLRALRDRAAAGATRLGLAVSGANRDALRLYLSVGLEVEREWLTYVPDR